MSTVLEGRATAANPQRPDDVLPEGDVLVRLADDGFGHEFHRGILSFPEGGVEVENGLREQRCCRKLDG